MDYYLKLTLKSPSIISSGEGFGTILDIDVVFDEAGIPYIPAKRIKGCLLDSVLEIQEMFELSKINNIKLPVEKIFGKKGVNKRPLVCFSNLYIKDYYNVKQWLLYYLKTNKYQRILSKESILETFTETRQQTSIDIETGASKKHSLRTFRLIKANTQFYGELFIEDDNDNKMVINTIALACMNFRNMGVRRNRGFGEVHCSLFNKDKKIDCSLLNEI